MLPVNLVYVVVAVIVAFVAAMYVLCSLTLLQPQWSRAGTHLAVSLTIIPTAAILTMLLAYTSSSFHAFISSFVQSYQENLPPLLVEMLQSIKPLDEQRLTVLSVQAMMCLLLVGYGSSVIWRNLIDIIRLLKISRRRLVQAEKLAISKKGITSAKSKC